MPVEPEPLPDLSTLSDDELTTRIRDLEQEEDAISFRRQRELEANGFVPHARIGMFQQARCRKSRRSATRAREEHEHVALHEPALIVEARHDEGPEVELGDR